MERVEKSGLVGQRQRSTAGALFGSSAYLIWGLSPLFWRVLQTIPALELICHRIVWSFAFLIPFVLFSGKQRNELKQIFMRPKTLVILLITSLLVGSNWLVYVWAVNNDRVLEASLDPYPPCSGLSGLPGRFRRGGRKAMEAGFQLSEYWMPGLGGKEMWEGHAKNTARVLNAINPDYIRSRPFFPSPGSPLFEAHNRGEFQTDK